jgi:hypothetical protein
VIDASPTRGNPFSTRYTRPGRVPFVFRDGEEVGMLVARLRAGGWWGEIIGPHGSGKSTLLAALMPALEAAGRDVLHVALHNGQRRLPADVWRRRFTRSTQPVIDGYEQLSRWQRLCLKRRCQVSGCGLLATAHAPTGLPELYRTRPDLETAIRVVQSLLADEEVVVSAEEITACFDTHRGDMRETLFALYDLCERRCTSR